VDIVGHVVSQHSISATWGPQDIISLVIPQNGDKTMIKEMGDWTSLVREREGQKSREYYINISQNIKYG
jgi:hypothetical protein